MVSPLVSGSSGPGSSPGRGHCVVFFTFQAVKNLYAHNTYLYVGPFCKFFGDF